MKLSESSFVLCQTFIKSFVIISCSVLWSSLIFNSAYAENTDKASFNIKYKDDVNELSQTLPYLGSGNSHSWRMNNKFPINSPLARIPTKNLIQSDQFPQWHKSIKRPVFQELPPPGFVGHRGKRQWDYEYYKAKRNQQEDFKTLNEVFPDLWPHLNDDQIDGSTDELMAARLASGKKSDSIVYKDGFLGVRG